MGMPNARCYRRSCQADGHGGFVSSYLTDALHDRAAFAILGLLAMRRAAPGD
jgi:hypothetical protein